ncbi:MAG TPA: glycosyl transferase, partial [Burkholderiaceae bacterium]
LLRLAWRRREPALAGMAFDMMVPPIAALVLGLVAIFLIDLIWYGLTDDGRALLVAAVALATLTVSVLAAWWSDGRRSVSLRELLGLPWYVAAKIPVYVRLFTRRQIEWIRTKRDDEPT